MTRGLRLGDRVRTGKLPDGSTGTTQNRIGTRSISLREGMTGVGDEGSWFSESG
jgi:hypothetical protein